MVSNVDYRRRIVVKQGLVAEATTMETTSSTAPSFDSKTIRSCCQHAAVISLTILSEPRHRRLLAVMTWWSAHAPEEAHGYQNKLCRSVADCSSYIVSDFTGAFLSQVQKAFGMLESRTALGDCEVHMDALPASRRSQDEPMLLEEDEWATLFGSLRLRMVDNRPRGRLWLFGWPHRWSMILDEKTDAKMLVKQFRADFEAFEELKANVGDDKNLSKLVERSQFQRADVLQFLEAMRCLG